jgi:flagellin-like hook-associated protein FlgL
MRELAIQAANDTNSLEDRKFLQEEVAALIKEIDRVATQTQYNSQTVLDGSFQNKSIQIGIESGQKVSLSVDSIQSAHLGHFSQLGSDLDGEFSGDLSGYTVSISDDGSVLAIGAPGNDENGDDTGHVRVYTLENGSWIQRGSDINGGAPEDYKGRSVSLSADGSALLVGAPKVDANGNDSGQASVYTWDGMEWIQRGSPINGEAADDYSGYEVSLSSNGNSVVISAPWNDDGGEDAGQVRIYDWGGSDWIQRGMDIDGIGSDQLNGFRISLSGDANRVAVSSLLNDDGGEDAGQVRVFDWDGSTWNQLGNSINGDNPFDFSGRSVSLSYDGDVVAIGATWNDGNGDKSGQIRVFEWDGSNWSKRGSDIYGESALDISGFSASLSNDGNTLAIGAIDNADGGDYSGQVRVYNWSAGSWGQVAGDINGEGAEDRSGWKVSISGDGSALAIGAPQNDGTGADAGHVRVFKMLTLSQVDISKDSESAVELISNVIDQVATHRAAYGALQNRLEYTVSNLMNVAEFTTSARSRIEDADFAAESARLAKAQVLQQMGTAMLAQANAQPQLALSLIR